MTPTSQSTDFLKVFEKKQRKRRQQLVDYYADQIPTTFKGISINKEQGSIFLHPSGYTEKYLAFSQFIDNEPELIDRQEVFKVLLDLRKVHKKRTIYQLGVDTHRIQLKTDYEMDEDYGKIGLYLTMTSLAVGDSPLIRSFVENHKSKEFLIGFIPSCLDHLYYKVTENPDLIREAKIVRIDFFKGKLRPYIELPILREIKSLMHNFDEVFKRDNLVTKIPKCKLPSGRLEIE